MYLDLSQFHDLVVIIPAAGFGQRMQSDTPKQYLTIQNQTLLEITVNKFLSYAPTGLIVLALQPGDQYCYQLPCCESEKVIIVDGGAERANSVFNALKFLYDSGLGNDIAVMVHDAARPCITHEDLNRLMEHFSERQQPCLLGSPVVDTLQRIDGADEVQGVVDRRNIMRAFTPQMARFVDLYQTLSKALEQGNLVTDEVSALTRCGMNVKVIRGREDNIKVTHPADLALAEFYLSQQV